MADITIKSGLISEPSYSHASMFSTPREAGNARVVDDPRDKLQSVSAEGKRKDEMHDLCAWVMNHVSRWRDHRRSNYELQWDAYERLWRGMWASEDKNRKSERSTLVTPALGEAVENIVAEVEEAVMGRGDLFDMKGEIDDSLEMKKVTDDNKANLKEDLSRPELPVIFTTAMGEALINAAVYGSGIGEIFVQEFKLKEIEVGVQNALQPALGALSADAPTVPGAPAAAPAVPMGALMPARPRLVVKNVTFSYLQSVNPRNFLIDPTARSVEAALGVAVEEYVGSHIVRAGQKAGDYRKVDVGTSAGDTELGADRQVENEYVYDKVKIVRYYGLVPKHLVFPADQTVELAPQVDTEVFGDVTSAADEVVEEILDPEYQESATSGQKSIEPIDAEMVESIIVIANDAVVLKATTTPYLMEDRPIVAFPWDIVPGRFWGRSVCEKGQVPQRVMDAELRARIDALAYVTAPMMGMDASKLPRGFQLTVKPGKSILTNGKPADVLQPMHFGQLDQSTFQHSQQLDQMVQRATGSLDVISLAAKAGGDARPGAVSMMLSGIVKRHKRTLMNFVDRFYVPALRKIMWRNMQFCPERYIPMNWSFTASSTMGILQREYESQTLSALMNTMDPTSKEYKILLMGVISNTGLAHRAKIVQMIEQSIENAAAMEQAQTNTAVDPVQAQLLQVGAQLQIAEMQAKIEELKARATLQKVKARNEMIEPEFRRAEVLTKGIYSIQADQQERAIKNRNDYLDRELEWEDIRSNERIARIQSGASVRADVVKSAGAIASERVRARAERTAAENDRRARATEAARDVQARVVEARADERARARDSVATVSAARAKQRSQFEGRQARVIR